MKLTNIAEELFLSLKISQPICKLILLTNPVKKYRRFVWVRGRVLVERASKFDGVDDGCETADGVCSGQLAVKFSINASESHFMQTPDDSLPIEVDIHTVKSMLDREEDFVLIDCREKDEFETARIGGSLLIPLSQLGDSEEELKSMEHRHVVIHCHHGGRSLRMAQWLAQNGFTRVQSMAGGIDQWSQLIDPSVPRY